MQTDGLLDVSLDRLLSLLPDAVCVVDAANRFVFVSEAGERIFGYPPAEMLGRSIYDFIHPDDQARTGDNVQQITAGRSTPGFRNRYVRKDGGVAQIMWSARAANIGDGPAVPGLRVAVARDVAVLHAAEQRQAALYAIAECANTHMGDLHGLLAKVLALLAQVIPVRACGVLLAQDAAAGTGTGPAADDDGADRPSTAAASAPPGTPQMTRTIASLDSAPGASRDFTWGAVVMREAGRPVPEDAQAGAALQCAAHAEPVPADWQGFPLRYYDDCLGVFFVHRSPDEEPSADAADEVFLRFVTTQIAAVVAREQAQERLRHMAAHDALTDLPNRALLADRLRGALAMHHRNPAAQVALLYLDLDGFKEINDRFGHATGDALLQVVARRLQHCVRATDTVARIGGDEFLLLLRGDDAAMAAQAVTRMVQRAFDEAFEIAEHVLRISPSIGCVLAPRHATDADTLMRMADAAMYRAKRAGGNQLKMALAD